VTTPPRKVVIVGQGYVGLPVAMRAVEVGFNVVGYDVDDDRIKLLSAGESPIEDISDLTLRGALASGRYVATSNADDIAGFDVAVISVPTPLSEGAPDLTYIEAAARTLGQYLTRDACVILESTTYPGTTEELICPILEDESDLSAGSDFHVGYSPERIDPGNPTWTFVNTPKVVSGIDDASLAAVRSFYNDLVDQTVPVPSTKDAELTKLLENTFRHVNIALVNELAMFANDLGVDVWSAIDAAATKPFGFMRFAPGPGVGGHCLPIDPSYLSWRVRRSTGESFRFVELANDINDHMPGYVVRRLMVALNRLGLAVRDRRILLAGFAYKRNTGDARETPTRSIARQLGVLGAHVCIADPHVADSQFPSDVERVDLTDDEIERADAVVLLVDHDEFDLRLLDDANYILDCRHRVTGPNVEHL